MNYLSIHKKYHIIYLILLFNCSQIPIPQANVPEKEDYLLNSSAYEKARENSREIKKIKVSYLNQIELIDSLFFMLNILAKEQKKQNINLRELNKAVKNDLLKIKNDYTSNLDSINIELTNILAINQNKLRVLEDRASYADSTNFEILNMLVMFEDKIMSLTDSYREISQLRNTDKIDKYSSISDAEYREKYIKALSSYQNGDYENSLDLFNYLININTTHDLADNCQYWIGEVYYGMKNYKRSIKEFEKVFTFVGTNKDDDAKYKLGLCYVNIGNLNKAKEEFQDLLDRFPNSEYYQKSKQYIQQI